MRIFGTLPSSLVNGDGIRYVIFLQGCKHFCEGCHNPESWDFNSGKEVSVDILAKDILKRINYIDGVTLTGGDPFYQWEECVKLLTILPTTLNFWLYTGFEYTQIKNTTLAKMVDVIVDGRYIKDLHISGEMYGSSNQKIIRKGKELYL